MIHTGDIPARMQALQCAVLIPTYNNAGTIERVVVDVLRYCRDVIVVNDGSTDDTAAILDSMDGISVIGYERNRGKGYALRTGLREAAKRGFRYLLTIDADGQHYPDDLPLFVEAAEQQPDTLFIGARNLTAENMPSKNTFANKFSNFWYKVETGNTLSDTQSGFRLYPLEKLKNMRFYTPRYEFEVEVIVRAAWKGIAVENIAIRVYYPPQHERVSHFKPVKDFTRISILNTCLVTWALFCYYPVRFLKWCRWSNIREFFSRYVMHSPESNRTMAASVAWGVCWGVMPVWGWQGVLAVVSGHFMKLNKVVTFAATNISIPPMIPIILFSSYVIGGWVLGRPLLLSFHDISLEALAGSLAQYLVGSVALAVACGILSYGVFRLLFLIFKRNGKRS
ncbi:DUF2062 domain-containing protein [uncultured Alistipes sp.]|jgi:glycosyltransferase family 2|uniref:DUF2062 domain-containing protein n=1 Tax=uncultured Alistipes sp. TaxID=538949 RepID=UPI0025F37CDF|nr:DUF2062 domain-containing protein [uncultured Alistipes sp.]